MICTIITHLKHVKPLLSIVSIDISPMWEFLSILMWEFWNVITSCTPSKSYICLYGFIVFPKTVQTMGYVRNVPKNKCASLSYPKVLPLWKAPPPFPSSNFPHLKCLSASSSRFRVRVTPCLLLTMSHPWGFQLPWHSCANKSTL